ncbi:hypothetical protein DAPPUDRAFT_330173 [Daphnia pulex]|uniref:Uncharacterized protein n=1 Tax=Daphnia pulex TaxID=6669 RepID=E9HIR7_DAPPU|nr:hypothetical protein DAPPUDRAFT_330173 [Daphnia pulex]|eukprot:EFX68367.1 hypothetical protein DAPPUDRAFT_330173 [Daphnia pulex]
MSSLAACDGCTFHHMEKYYNYRTVYVPIVAVASTLETNVHCGILLQPLLMVKED